MKPVAVIDTGSANTRSMFAALRRIGLDPRFVETEEEIAEAERLVLPGVGTFGNALDSLAGRGWTEPLRTRLERGRRTLAVCVGLQVLARSSEENPGRGGLGLIPGQVVALRDDVRRPHMGWNRVEVEGDDRASGHAYFAHSYCIEAVEAPRLREAGWSLATTEHGNRFVSALWRGEVLACQFHPELSGAWGLGWLEAWSNGVRGEVASC